MDDKSTLNGNVTSEEMRLAEVTMNSLTSAQNGSRHSSRLVYLERRISQQKCQQYLPSQLTRHGSSTRTRRIYSSPPLHGPGRIISIRVTSYNSGHVPCAHTDTSGTSRLNSIEPANELSTNKLSSCQPTTGPVAGQYGKPCL